MAKIQDRPLFERRAFLLPVVVVVVEVRAFFGSGGSQDALLPLVVVECSSLLVDENV